MNLTPWTNNSPQTGRHVAPRRSALARVGVLLGVAASLAQTNAQAAEPIRDNQISLSATATAELPLDVLGITLRVQREGVDAVAVQAQLKQALEAALVEARKSAQADAMELSTTGFSLSPRYGREGKPTGWSGSADLLLEGRDIARVAATAGRLTQLSVVGTRYTLSRQAREQQESDLSAQAVRKFRQRAGELAKQFGFSSYTLGQIDVGSTSADAEARPVLGVMRALAAPAADAPVPVEAGKASLSVTVQGSVLLVK